MKLIRAAVPLFAAILSVHCSGTQEIPETFCNPILGGFHPDPSICRVGEDYYLVNSSFEWFPGVPVYHSKDLVNWKQIGNVLDRPSQLDMKPGLKHDQGIYAPTIRYHDGLFYMITTAVGSGGNFFVTARRPEGPWSDPVWIEEANGIDPSLFWDDDGECWYAGAGRVDGPPRWQGENRIYVARLDTKTGRFLSQKTEITSGHASNARWTEGPHIFRIEGRYILIAAEGGTGEHHAVTVFGSDAVDGPYTPSHTNPVLTHRHLGKDYPIAQVGHADLVRTQNGEWWSVLLGKRAQAGYLLSRETFLARVAFEEGWPLFNPGEGKVGTRQRRPDLPWTPVDDPYRCDHFDRPELGFEYCMLRTPVAKWWSLSEGRLALDCRNEPLTGEGNPSMLARRIEHHEFDVSTTLTLDAGDESCAAGLAAFRTNENHYTLLKTNSHVILTQVSQGTAREIAREEFAGPRAVLTIRCRDERLRFFFGGTPDEMRTIGTPQPAGILSDSHGGRFNGPFVGMAALSGRQHTRDKALFDSFEYTPFRIAD